MTTVINVSEIEPRLKHPTIFAAFDEAKEGESVMIYNDHDPKPLYYQLLGERGNIFNWSYLQEGPEVWQVEISKRAAAKETIGQIAASDIRKAEVFKRLGMDFCCGGKTSLSDACRDKGLDEEKVRQELEQVTRENGNASNDYGNWKLSFLCDYIENVHHGYLRKNMPVIEELAAHVANRHGSNNPALVMILQRFNEMVAELTPHMMKEEHILFPYIKKLELGIAMEELGLGSIKKPVWMMEMDHEIVGRLAGEVQNLSDNFSVPANACQSQTLLMFKLQEFDNNLKEHIHLENNILFPKAMKLDEQRSANSQGS